jgi:hypothetical protein
MDTFRDWGYPDDSKQFIVFGARYKRTYIEVCREPGGGGAGGGAAARGSKGKTAEAVGGRRRGASQADLR